MFNIVPMAVQGKRCNILIFGPTLRPMYLVPPKPLSWIRQCSRACWGRATAPVAKSPVASSPLPVLASPPVTARAGSRPALCWLSGAGRGGPDLSGELPWWRARLDGIFREDVRTAALVSQRLYLARGGKGTRSLRAAVAGRCFGLPVVIANRQRGTVGAR